MTLGAVWIGFLNDLFYGRSYIAGPREMSIPFLLEKNPLLYRSAWPESSREASERFLMETLGRTQSERRRRLALGVARVREDGSGQSRHRKSRAGRACLTPLFRLRKTPA